MPADLLEMCYLFKSFGGNAMVLANYRLWQPSSSMLFIFWSYLFAVFCISCCGCGICATGCCSGFL